MFFLFNRFGVITVNFESGSATNEVIIWITAHLDVVSEQQLMNQIDPY